MPVIHRFPVLAWQDQQGAWTAQLLDRDEPAGFGPTIDLALDQLENYLIWDFAEHPWEEAPDFEEPVLLVFEVPVRPEYEVESRRFPCDESVTLQVHAVRGKQKHGLLICALPALGLRFYFHEAQALRNLVTHYVQQHLEAATPQALARYLPPVQARIETIPVPVRPRRNTSRAPGPTALLAVAESLEDPVFRKQFSRPYERDRQVSELVRRLGKERANVLLVGEAGSGKTTVLVDAVRLLAREKDEDADQKSRRYWQTSGGRLIAGMKYLGQWEERCEAMIATLGEVNGVLAVESLLDLVRQGGETPTNSLAAFFLPYLQRGELRMVAEATPGELDACRRLLPGLVDVFQILPLPPFSRTEALRVLEHLTNNLKANLHLEVGRGVPGQVYHLFRRFQPDGAFPGRAVTFLENVFEGVRQRQGKGVVPEDIVTGFIRQTGLPELFLRDEVPLARTPVEEEFCRQVMGQEAACRVAADLVTTFKAGMNDPNRPVGVLLFSGPTGVGKTEMARALARYFYGHGEASTEDRLIRLDMSEYTGWRASERLLMTADGGPSELIQKVRQQPFRVLLLDEVEKADPEVFDVLLGMFDEGRVTDRLGRMTSFRSTIIVMTSNLGAGKREGFGFGGQASTDYASEAMAFFRPEFFNRIDEVVTFDPLSSATIRAITRKELGEVARREGIRRLGVRITWSARLEEHLAREGYDERYGARPLQRALEAKVVTPLAGYLLEHPEAKGTTLHVDVDETGQVRIE